MTLLHASFIPSWSNPLWEMLGFPIISEAEPITAELRAAFINMEAFPNRILPLDDAASWRDFGLAAPSAANASIPAVQKCMAALVFICALGCAIRDRFRTILEPVSASAPPTPDDPDGKLDDSVLVGSTTVDAGGFPEV